MAQIPLNELANGVIVGVDTVDNVLLIRTPNGKTYKLEGSGSGCFDDDGCWFEDPPFKLTLVSPVPQPTNR